MSKSDVSSLGWSQRFALIDRYTPSDAQICQAFGVSSDELSTARDLRASGTFAPDATLPVDDYAEVFGGEVTTASTKPSARKGSKKATSHSKGSKNAAPATATKATKSPKKRGRQGSKIVNAFKAIPATPVAAETFATDHGISLAVLRQSKRFDKTGLDGAVRVKKDRESGTLMIWREATAA